MDLGTGRGAIRRWRDSGRLHRVNAGVYAVGHERLTVRGRWMAAVLTCREGTLLSHGDAGALWDLVPVGGGRIHVTVPSAGTRRRSGLAVHETARLEPEERAVRDAIPVTSVPRTLLDLAESDPRRLSRAWDAAERLRLLDVRAVERTCERGHGRRGLKHLLPLVADRTRVIGDTRRELEARFFGLCRRYAFPCLRATSWSRASWSTRSGLPNG